jgi:hypothetical protein
MNKATLTMLTFSVSLATMVLITNPANASTVEESVINPVISAPNTQLVNLNRATSMLNLSVQESNPITDQLGCSCATCQSARNQMPG